MFLVCQNTTSKLWTSSQKKPTFAPTGEFNQPQPFSAYSAFSFFYGLCICRLSKLRQIVAGYKTGIFDVETFVHCSFDGEKTVDSKKAAVSFGPRAHESRGPRANTSSLILTNFWLEHKSHFQIVWRLVVWFFRPPGPGCRDKTWGRWVSSKNCFFCKYLVVIFQGKCNFQR